MNITLPAHRRPWLHRATDDDDTGTSTSTDTTTDAAADANTDGTDTSTDASTDTAGEAALGDPGKKALDAMKAKWKAAEKKAADEAAARAALQAKVDGQEQEHQHQLEQQRVRDDALAAANTRIKKAEIRTSAKGKLSDPNDALTFIDLDSIDVDDEGNVDVAAIDAAIDELLSKKPYLAAQGGSRFQGTGDGGPRNGDPKPPQLTEAEVKKLYAEGKHDEIVKAKAAGRLDDYLKS